MTKLEWDEAPATNRLSKAEAMFGTLAPDATVSLAFKNTCVVRDEFEYNWARKDESEASFKSFLTTLQSYFRAKQRNKSETPDAEDQVKIPQDLENLLTQSKTPGMPTRETMTLVHIKITLE